MKILVLDTYDKRGTLQPSMIYVGNEFSPDPIDMLQRIQTAYLGKVFVNSNRSCIVGHIDGGSSTDTDYLDRLLLSQGYLREEVARVSHIHEFWE